MVATGLDDNDDENGYADEAPVEEEEGWFPHGSKSVRKIAIRI